MPIARSSPIMSGLSSAPWITSKTTRATARPPAWRPCASASSTTPPRPSRITGSLARPSNSTSTISTSAQSDWRGATSATKPIAAYQEILERWTDDPLALQRLAAVYYSRAQYRETLKVAGRLAQASDPKWAVAGYSLIGTVHHDQHHFELAVEANKKVLRAGPGTEAL